MSVKEKQDDCPKNEIKDNDFKLQNNFVHFFDSSNKKKVY